MPTQSPILTELQQYDRLQTIAKEIGVDFPSDLAPQDVRAKRDELALTARFAKLLGVPEDEIAAEWGDEAAERANHGDMKGCGPRSVAMQCLYLAGCARTDGRFLDEDLERLFSDEIQAYAGGGFGTNPFKSVASNAMRKALLTSYESVQLGFRALARDMSTPDYKPNPMYRVQIKGQKMPRVAPSGELKHIDISETEFSVKVAPHGAKLAVPETVITNDDIDAVGQAVRDVGAWVAETVELTLGELFFNPPQVNGRDFWIAGVNHLTGAGSVFGVDGLRDALLRFNVMRDQTSGRPARVRPDRVLVGPLDEFEAESLFRSSTFTTSAAGSTDTVVRRGDANIYQNRFRPHVSPDLDEGTTVVPGLPANSRPWFLSSDPDRYAPFHVAYLNGEPTPTITEWQKIPGHLGRQWDFSMAFDVAPGDPNTIVRCDGI